MPADTGPSDTPSSGRHRKWRKRGIVIGVFALACFLAYLLITLRGPSEYTGDLARLLPVRTSGFAVLYDLEGILSYLGQTPLYEKLSNSIDLAALLMTSDDWREYQLNKDSLEWKAKAALAREFLRRYFSHEVAIAVARLDRCDEPALLVMARTELGFAEKLGELCAELYPELRLSREKYRGIPLYAYEATKSRRSFTFVRFGKTVVLSLRSNEREYLRRIIDYRLDSPSETLANTDEFRKATQSPARKQGLLAVARPTALLKDLAWRPEFNLRRFLRSHKRTFLHAAAGKFHSLWAAVTVSGRIEIQLTARPDPTTSPLVLLPGLTKPLTMLDAVPADCLAFCDFDLGDLSQELVSLLTSSTVAADQLKGESALSASRNFSRAVGGEAVLVLHDMRLPGFVTASLLLDVTDRAQVEAAIARQANERASALGHADRGRDSPTTFGKPSEFRPGYGSPLGLVSVGWLGDRCLLSLGENSLVAMREVQEKRRETIARNPVFASLDLPASEPLVAVAYFNLEEIGRRAGGFLAVGALLSKEVRDNSALYGKIIAVAQMLRGVGLFAQARDMNVLVRRGVILKENYQALQITMRAPTE